MFGLIAENAFLRRLLLLALFALVAAIVYFVATGVAVRQLARRRLVEDGPQVAVARSAGTLRTDQSQSTWLKLVNAIEKSGLSLVDTKDKALRQRLIAAGYTAPYGPRLYTLTRIGLVVVLPVMLLGLYRVMGSSPSLTKLYITLSIAAALGLYLPSIFIRARADRRQREIINGFPDALDLMLVCVEAGLGLEAAFARVGQEMTNSHPRLAEQLGAVVLELRAGRQINLLPTGEEIATSAAPIVVGEVVLLTTEHGLLAFAQPREKPLRR